MNWQFYYCEEMKDHRRGIYYRKHYIFGILVWET